MHEVRPKKFLGQHFLKDQNIARKIVDALSPAQETDSIIEIGPGTGVLTRLLVKKNYGKLLLIELDRDSIKFLKENMQQEDVAIIEGDFLKINIDDYSKDQLLVIGNFPYNISSQIFFKILEMRTQVKEVVCMIQKEVADRICAPHGNKTYGILSVLIGAHYQAEMLLKVPPHVFVPPPKVTSAVIRLTRKDDLEASYDLQLFKKIVKQGFQNRRKTLRNALKPIFLPLELTKLEVFDKRAEQLSVEDFMALTNTIQQWKK